MCVISSPYLFVAKLGLKKVAVNPQKLGLWRRNIIING